MKTTPQSGFVNTGFLAWPIWMTVGVAVLFLDDLLPPLLRYLVSRSKPLTFHYGFILNKPLFPQPLAMILRFTCRLLGYTAKLCNRCGFCRLEKMLEDLSLRIFTFFFRRFHGDILKTDVHCSCQQSDSPQPGMSSGESGAETDYKKGSQERPET